MATTPRFELLRSHDLNQLTVLLVLLTTKSVTKAAKQLDLSQPSVSKSLERLRVAFGDPLLVRHGNAMRLTPRAQGLLPLVATALERLDAVFSADGPFDPAQARGRFCIGANDYVQLVLGGKLLRRMRDAAPRVVLEFRPPGMLHPEQLLNDGVVDLVIGTKWPNLSLRSQVLYSDPFVCLVGAAHPPLPARLDRQGFCELEHLDVSPAGISLLREMVDRALAAHGQQRRVVAKCSSFMAVQEMLGSTGLAALIPRRLLPLFPRDSVRVVDLDFDLPPYEVSLWWHNATHADSLARWVRKELLELAAEPAR